jgi:hypothetical protein
LYIRNNSSNLYGLCCGVYTRTTGRSGNFNHIVVNGDTTGSLAFTVNNTTLAFTLDTGGAFGVGTSPSYGTAGQYLTSAGSGAAPTWTTLVSGAEPFVLFVNGGNTSPGDPQSALGII